MLQQEIGMAAKTWYDVLEAARGLHGNPKGPFTKDDLAQAAGIQDGPKSLAGRIASAWLTKFVKWGYVERVGEIPGAGIRPTYQYAVTEKGLTAKYREGTDAQLSRLMDAVRMFAPGRPRRGRGLQAPRGHP
jgi:hypothetical protein